MLVSVREGLIISQPGACRTACAHVERCVQDAIEEWVKKGSTPKLPALDKKPYNRKALQAAFSDQKPKLIGVMPATADGLAAFKEKLTAVRESNSDIHVRLSSNMLVVME
jgi:hypothetical protein